MKKFLGWLPSLNLPLLLIFALLFSIIACKQKPSVATIPGEFSQESEFRLQKEGIINLTQTITANVAANNNLRGLGLSLPLHYQANNKKFNLKYKVLYALHNETKTRSILQEKDDLALIYLGDLTKFLPAGKHSFTVQIEISGYDFKQNGFEEFSWYPIKNFNAAISKATIKVFPAKPMHPKIGRYFSLLWNDLSDEKPQKIVPFVGEDHITFSVQQVPAASRLQIIARWPIAEMPVIEKTPAQILPCAEFGTNYTWNTTTGKCERKGE